MPVSVSPIDRKIGAVLRKFILDRRNQVARLLVDGTLSIEVVIVFGDGQHALAGNVASAKDVFEEGNHVIVTLRTAEGDNQDCVVVHAHDLASCGLLTKKIRSRKPKRCFPATAAL